jgi:hypothetical protein
VTFRATLGPSYVTSTPNQIHQTVYEFLNGGLRPGHIQAPPHPARGARHSKAPSVPLAPATADELAGAHAAAGRVPFPLYYPVGRVTAAYAAPDMVRTYRLHGNGAYVVVIAQGGLGQYYDLEGTTWTHPPILDNPSQTITTGSRKLQLYFEGQRLRVVAWHDGPAVYWLTNTLQNILTNRQMLAIAAAAKPVT